MRLSFLATAGAHDWTLCFPGFNLSNRLELMAPRYMSRTPSQSHEDHQIKTTNCFHFFLKNTGRTKNTSCLNLARKTIAASCERKAKCRMQRLLFFVSFVFMCDFLLGSDRAVTLKACLTARQGNCTAFCNHPKNSNPIRESRNPSSFPQSKACGRHNEIHCEYTDGESVRNPRHEV